MSEIWALASATVSTFRLTGMTFSMGIVMLLIAVYVGSAKVMPENDEQFLTAMRVSFTIFAALCALGIFASLARGKVRK